MSSSYLKAQEDGKRKRAQTREQMRIKFAGQALMGIISRGYTTPELMAKQATEAAEALIKSLGYAHEVKPSDLTEEEKELIDQGMGMSSQRELVQAMIRRRVSRAKKMKEEKIGLSAREIVINFLGKFDEQLQASRSVVEKYWLIESEAHKLLASIRSIDPDVEIELVWFGDDIQNMRLEGISIHWGENYRVRTGVDKQELIDLTSILLA